MVTWLLCRSTYISGIPLGIILTVGHIFSLHESDASCRKALRKYICVSQKIKPETGDGLFVYSSNSRIDQSLNSLGLADGNLLSLVSLPHLTWWEPVWIYANPSFKTTSSHNLGPFPFSGRGARLFRYKRAWNVKKNRTFHVQIFNEYPWSCQLASAFLKVFSAVFIVLTRVPRMPFSRLQKQRRLSWQGCVILWCPPESYARKNREPNTIIVLAYLMWCELTISFETISGVRQGCSISSFIFNFVMDEIKKNASASPQDVRTETTND